MRRGDREAARAILDGPTYARYKQVLSEGTARFVDGMIASVSPELVAVEQRGVAAIVLRAAPFDRRVARSCGAHSTPAWKSSETAMLEAERHDQDAGDDRPPDRASPTASRCARRCTPRSAAPTRNGTKLAVIMLDLDRFKPVNDRHGHLIGDLVLKTVASRMGVVLRRGEFRARYGGDEFVAVVEYARNDEIPRTHQPPPDRRAVGADGLRRR